MSFFPSVESVSPRPIQDERTPTIPTSAAVHWPSANAAAALGRRRLSLVPNHRAQSLWSQIVQVGPRYTRAFFARSCLEVAPALVGAYIVRTLKGEKLVGRIMEVEAYLGDGTDPGAHSDRGPTPRTRAMFGAPGHLYVYLSYGIHTCANVVCEPEGCGAAVLFRAIDPVQGVETMRALRGLGEDAPSRCISNGPGKLCRALGITRDDYGRDLLRGEIELRRPRRGDRVLEVGVGRRVGLTQGVLHPYRFFAAS